MVNKVKISRLEKGMTQEDLARRAKVTRQTISLIEKGDYNPSLKLCLEICYALGKTLDQIFWIDKEDKTDEKDK